jgi:hypothetical protein
MLPPKGKKKSASRADSDFQWLWKVLLSAAAQALISPLKNNKD